VSTVLGMPLDVSDDALIASVQPLEALVVIKGLDSGGDVVYCTAATKGLQSVECLGMAEYAVLRLKHGITRRIDGDGPL
jgi:hypothetical protein